MGRLRDMTEIGIAEQMAIAVPRPHTHKLAACRKCTMGPITIRPSWGIGSRDGKFILMLCHNPWKSESFETFEEMKTAWEKLNATFGEAETPF